MKQKIQFNLESGGVVIVDLNNITLEKKVYDEDPDEYFCWVANRPNPVIVTEIVYKKLLKEQEPYQLTTIGG